MNRKVSIVTLLIIATLTMSFTPTMVTQVQGSHPEALAERDECRAQAFVAFNFEHSDDPEEDAEALRDWNDDNKECDDEYNEHTEPDFD